MSSTQCHGPSLLLAPTGQSTLPPLRRRDPCHIQPRVPFLGSPVPPDAGPLGMCDPPMTSEMTGHQEPRCLPVLTSRLHNPHWPPSGHLAPPPAVSAPPRALQVQGQQAQVPLMKTPRRRSCRTLVPRLPASTSNLPGNSVWPQSPLWPLASGGLSSRSHSRGRDIPSVPMGTPSPTQGQGHRAPSMSWGRCSPSRCGPPLLSQRG